jgi:hypothetical protein
MINKKYILVSLILICLLTLPLSALAENEETNNQVRDFILKVYSDYHENEFTKVYEGMHPDIKEVLDKDKYLQFQEENTAKYDLKISEVEVLGIKQIESWPEEFKEIIKEKENQALFEIALKYKTTYQSGGNENEKVIDKKTYVTVNDEDIFLLWDPNIIK